MAISTPVDIGKGVAGTGSISSMSLTTTADVAVGDLLLLVIAGGSTATSGSNRWNRAGLSISFGSNSFTNIANATQDQTANSQAGISVYYCVATNAVSSGSSLSMTFTTVATCSANCALIQIASGFNSSTPVDVAGSSASASGSGWTATTSASITDGDDLVLAGSWNISSGAKTSTPGNIDGSASTELIDYTQTTGRSLTVEYRLLSGASLATKTGAGTWSGTGTHHADFVVAVEPGSTPAALSGTAAGTGDSTGALTATALLTGSAAGAGATDGAVSVPGLALLTGTADGTSTTTGLLRAIPQVAGTAAGTGSASGIVILPGGILGTAAGAGGTIGLLSWPRTPALERMVAFGSSLGSGTVGDGTQADSTSGRYTYQRVSSRVAQALGLAEQNIAVSGAGLASDNIDSGNPWPGPGGWVQLAQAFAPTQGNLSSPLGVGVFFGSADLAMYATTQNWRDAYPTTIHAAIRRLRACHVFENDDAAFSRTGSWTLVNGTSRNSGSSYRTTSTAGTTVTFTVPAWVTGTVNVDWLTPFATGAQPTIAFDKNGVTVATVDLTTIPVINSVEVSPHTQRITGAQAGDTITATYSNLAGGVAIHDSVSIESTSPPLIALVELYDFTDYSAFAGWPNPPADTAAGNALMQEVRETLRTIAATYPDNRVVTVRTDDLGITENASLRQDYAHPNAAGAQLIADRVVERIGATGTSFGTSDPLVTELVHYATASGTSTSATTGASPQAVTAGDDVYVAVGIVNTAGTPTPATGVTDSKGNTYTRVGDIGGGGTNRPVLSVFRANVTSAVDTSTTWTASWASQGGSKVVKVLTAQGLITDTPDTTSTGGGTSTALVSWSTGIPAANRPATSTIIGFAFSGGSGYQTSGTPLGYYGGPGQLAQTGPGNGRWIDAYYKMSAAAGAAEEVASAWTSATVWSALELTAPETGGAPPADLTGSTSGAGATSGTPSVGSPTILLNPTALTFAWALP